MTESRPIDGAPALGHPLERRSFLGLAAASTVAVASVVVFGIDGRARPTQDGPIHPAASTQYRGTKDGKIYVSHDGRATWHLLSDFGPDLSITSVRATRRSVVASLKLSGRGSFRLKLLADDLTWHTM